MATSIYPPTITTNILVNTRTTRKIVYLPAASTIGPGRLLFIKDICGNAANSSIFVSTTGLDTFENRFRPSTLYALMSTNFQSILMASDGALNWMFLQNYNANAISIGSWLLNFTTFSATNFNVGGTATFINGEARITSNTVGVVGSVYYNQKLNIQTFTTQFTMRFELTNADGGAFVIQNQSSNAVGGAGGNIGYSGITPSVAIRFDTFGSGIGECSTDVLSNGNIPSGIAGSGNLNATLGVSVNTTWNFFVNVTYNGTNFSYTITNTSNGSNFSSNTNINIPSILGANTAWIGFVGATGGATEFQYISSWQFRN